MEPQPEIENALAKLVQQLREAAGENLLGVALYGGLAKGRYTPGIPDSNLLIVLAGADGEPSQDRGDARNPAAGRGLHSARRPARPAAPGGAGAGDPGGADGAIHRASPDRPPAG